ncbi:hypothetical protein OIU84_014183 [Salix udensis]|uniref:Epoxide hydrolase n=1 Tax=Salix udensis TaxID=889485 RepID=A0AAD6NRQ8_9ROSI|nr:hypothetical protein OIU84_014183 [Salix udensis]
MDQIHHKYVNIRGVKLHIAETGTGSSVVVFIHGFPEIWHPLMTLWRISLLSLIIFKLRRPSWQEKILVPGLPLRYKDLPEGFYIHRWKEPGRAEADFSRFDVKTVWRNIYILFSRNEIPIADKDKEIMDLVDPSNPLPSWLSSEDLAIYAEAYEKSGFDSPMRAPYKGLHREFTIRNPVVKAPVLLIIGGQDYFLKFPGIEEYLASGKVREYMSDLQIKTLPEGSHFVQEQFPDQVNQLIIDFLDKQVRSS